MATNSNKTIEEIQDWLVDNISARLEMDPSEIDLNEPITHIGLSSREAIMVSGELEDWLGFELPPELLYEYPEIRSLAAKLAEGPEAFQEVADEPAFNTSPREDRDEMTYESFVELVRARVREIPDRKTFIFLRDGENVEAEMTLAELDLRARAIAAELQKRGMEGKRAMLIYPPGIEFISGLIGCFYANVIAVPAYPPTKTRGMDRLESIANDCDAQLALTTQAEAETILNNRKVADDAYIRKVEILATEAIPNSLAEQWKQPQIDHETIAFLQYTSGSTGDPKGVMVSHGNMLHNLKTIREVFEAPEHCTTVAWLPMFHDMGLIGHVLEPINIGSTQVSMPPTAFLEKPARWIRAIAKYNAQYSTGPNFAFDLCVEKIKDEDLEGVDLSLWHTACNGSEPVREDTMERFYERFKKYGFQRKTFMPSYGMAETTLLISAGRNYEEPKITYVDGDAMENNMVQEADPAMESTVSKVGCGRPRGGQLVIANPETFEALGENQVGEIWFKGESVTKGYWNKPEVNKIIYDAYTSNSNEGPFLRTGDLGFIQNGEVYITGRLKDLIIIRGRNHYPQDIEETVQNSHPALTVNGGAVFTIDEYGEERLVIVQEVERVHLRSLDQEKVFEKIRATVAEEHNLQVYAITLLSPARLPRTTSGKIQRRASKKGFLDGSLVKVGEWKMELSAEVFTHASQSDDDSIDITDLLTQTPEERKSSLEAYFIKIIAKTLRIPSDKVEVNKPVINLGLDSMHAIEIKNRIETDFLFELPVTQFMEGVSIKDLADLASTKIEEFDLAVVEDPEEADDGGPAQELNIEEISAEEARELLVDIDKLSQEQIEKLLAKLSDED